MITDYPTNKELQVLHIVNKCGSIRDYKLFDKLKPLKKGHIIAPHDLVARGFITSSDGSEGSVLYTITSMGTSFIGLHEIRKTIDEGIDRVLRESRAGYSDYLKERIKSAKAYKARRLLEAEGYRHFSIDIPFDESMIGKYAVSKRNMPFGVIVGGDVENKSVFVLPIEPWLYKKDTPTLQVGKRLA